MKTRFPSIERIGILSGLFTAIGMIVFFLIMNALGYSHVIELRFVNFVILAVGISVSINKYKHDLHNPDFYLQGWGQGLYTSFIAWVVFGLFMSIYLTVYNHDLYKYINESGVLGNDVSGFTIFASLLMEGMAGGFVITLAAMQYFKTNGAVKRKTHIPER